MNPMTEPMTESSVASTSSQIAGEEVSMSEDVWESLVSKSFERDIFTFSSNSDRQDETAMFMSFGLLQP